MYYVTQTDNGLMVHEMSGSPWWPITCSPGEIRNWNLSGNVLVISYTDGRTDVLDVDNRSKIR